MLDEIEDNAATLDDDGASSSQSKSGHKSSSSGMARAIGGKGGLQVCSLLLSYFCCLIADRKSFVYVVLFVIHTAVCLGVPDQ